MNFIMERILPNRNVYKTIQIEMEQLNECIRVEWNYECCESTSQNISTSFLLLFVVVVVLFREYFE